MTWSYYWRRCFFVNRNKVGAFADMGEGGNIRAELRFGVGDDGHEREDDPDYPGTIGHHAWGELPQRAFYRRYLEFLTSHEWPRIANDDTGQPLEGRTQR